MHAKSESAQPLVPGRVLSKLRRMSHHPWRQHRLQMRCQCSFSKKQRPTSCLWQAPCICPLRNRKTVIKLLAGPFDGMAHATALADRSMDRAVRGCLLRLLEALLAPEAAQGNDKARKAAAANGWAFVGAGGVQLAVDLVAGQGHHSLSGASQSCLPA